MGDENQIRVKLFGYLGILVGITMLCLSIIQVGKFNPFDILWGLLFIVPSYNLLKLKNWARIFLIIITLLLAIPCLSVNAMVFILNPLIRQNFVSLFTMVAEVLNSTPSSTNTIMMTFVFLLWSLYSVSFVIFFIFSKAKKEF